jgi:HSP20 family molecular chaperone IbpA
MLTLHETKRNNFNDTLELIFHVPGNTKDSFVIYVEETSLNSNKFNLHIKLFYEQSEFIYELDDTMDTRKIKANVLNGILSIYIPARRKIEFEIDIT